MYKVIIHKEPIEYHPFIVDTYEQALEIADKWREHFLLPPDISIIYIG